MPSRIEIVDQDLTTAANNAGKSGGNRLDAIIYAASSDFKASSPQAAALYHAAGPNMAIEADQLAPCPVGEARITRAYNLPCKYLIHTVPPRWGGGEAGEDQTLAGCYRNALHLAKSYDINSIALAALGGEGGDGGAGFPQLRAAHIAMTELLLFLKAAPSFKRLLLCCPDEALAQSYESAFDKHAA